MMARDQSWRQWLAMEQVRQLLSGSIKHDSAGALVFHPTDEMSEYMREAGSFWFLATDGVSKLRGGSAGAPESRIAEDTMRGWRQGTTLQFDAGGRNVGVLLGGERGSIIDGIGAWLRDGLRRWLLAFIPLAACTTLLTVWLVRYLLRPVRLAAHAALSLKLGQHVAALPEIGVPAEILPLVSATNAAFARLEEEHERQRRFMANAAHELRTPIAILGLRLDEMPAGRLKQQLAQDVRRLTLLANQLLDLERLHHTSSHGQIVDLVALARDVAAEMAPLSLDSNSTLSFQSVVPCLSVLGDEQALRRVLVNLVANAFMHGGRDIQVAIRITPDGLIEVADGGSGIPVEAQERIFEAFQRGSIGVGAGLGLYIVREVLRAHGAVIELRDGKPGTVFRIRFAQVEVRAHVGVAA
jgi:signal transduction histidine kinase